MITLSESIMTESLDVPSEGIFWVINGSFVCFDNPVNNPLSIQDDLTHISVCKHIKSKYKVDGRTVSYNYFTRGRVSIIPIKNNGKVDYYDVSIYMDKCLIGNDEVYEMIENKFRLYLKSCKVSIEGQLGMDGSHYNCHNCRKD